MAKILAYQIESGWEKAPFWWCPVEYQPVKSVKHLHTTKRLGDAPSVFHGVVSGLVFIARGSTYPIESRHGRLLVAESEKPLENLTNEAAQSLQWKSIEIKDAIGLIQSA